MNNNEYIKSISVSLIICIGGAIYMDARLGNTNMPDHFHSDINYNSFLATSASSINAVASGTSTTNITSFTIKGS